VRAAGGAPAPRRTAPRRLAPGAALRSAAHAAPGPRSHRAGGGSGERHAQGPLASRAAPAAAASLRAGRARCARARRARPHCTCRILPTPPPAPPPGAPPRSYPTLATLLLAGGLVASAGFLLYEAGATRHTRKVSQEVVLGGAASVMLGLGTLFLLLWTGVYV
jgi:hypothetical protein